MTEQKEPDSQTTRTATKPDSNDQKPNEGSQNSPPLPQIKILLDVARWLVALILTGEWPIVLLAVSAILMAGFLPGAGLIIKGILPEPHPLLYERLFWLIECSLIASGFCLLLLRDYQNLQVAKGKRSSTSKKRRVRFLSIFSAVMLFLVGGFYARQDLRAAVRPSLYLECDVSGDCFSWGENVLTSYGYIEDADSLESKAFSEGNEELKKKSQRDDTWEQCKQHWRLKASAVALYDTEKAISTLEDFRGRCKNDAEALIYKNNLEALSKGKTYDIAVSLPISSEGEEPESQEVLRGVAIAQYKINQSGISGRRVLVGIADDGFIITPGSGDKIQVTKKEREAAKHIAENLVAYDRLLGIVGHFSSDATEEAAKIYTDDSDDLTNIVAVSPTSTAVRSVRDSSSPNADPEKGIDLPDNIFRTALNDETVVNALVENISDKYKKVGVVYEGNSLYSSLFKESFLSVFKDQGGELMSDEAQEECNFNRTASYDETKCLEAAHDEKVKALLLVPSTKSSRSIRDLIIKNSEEFNFPLLGADSMYASSFLHEKTKGMLVYVTWHRSDSSENRSDFEKAAIELFDTPNINWRTATAYDATMALKRGIEIASSNQCKRNKLLWISRIPFNDREHIRCLRSHLGEAMHSEQFSEDGSSEDDPIKFKESGDIQRGNRGTFVEVRKRGEDYDFVGL